jgi:hypothetical protein
VQVCTTCRRSCYREAARGRVGSFRAANRFPLLPTRRNGFGFLMRTTTIRYVQIHLLGEGRVCQSDTNEADLQTGIAALQAGHRVTFYCFPLAQQPHTSFIAAGRTTHSDKRETMSELHPPARHSFSVVPGRADIRNGLCTLSSLPGKYLRSNAATFWFHARFWCPVGMYRVRPRFCML